MFYLLICLISERFTRQKLHVCKECDYLNILTARIGNSSACKWFGVRVDEPPGRSRT